MKNVLFGLFYGFMVVFVLVFTVLAFKADYNRNILVREAEAKKESAEFLSQAYVIRAKGISEANMIMKLIDEMQNNNNLIIYLPTDTDRDGTNGSN